MADALSARVSWPWVIAQTTTHTDDDHASRAHEPGVLRAPSRRRPGGWRSARGAVTTAVMPGTTLVRASVLGDDHPQDGLVVDDADQLVALDDPDRVVGGERGPRGLPDDRVAAASPGPSSESPSARRRASPTQREHVRAWAPR